MWSQQGKDFIKRLIVLEPLERLTATEAVNHDWFQKPTRVAVELDKLYERSIVFWSKVSNYFGIVEDLPNVFPDNVSRKKTRPSKEVNAHQKPPTHMKIPDASSPYFGLERYLHLEGPRTKSSMYLHRKRILEELKEADCQFIDTTSQLEKGAVSKTARLKSTSPFQSENFDTEMTNNTASIRRPAEPISTITTVDAPASQSKSPTFTLPKRRSIASSSRGANIDGAHIATLKGPRSAQEKMDKGITANIAQYRQLSTYSGLNVRQVDTSELFDTIPIEIKAAEAAEAEHAAYDDLQSFLHDGDEEIKDSAEKPAKPLIRSYSLSQDDRKLYDDAAKELPKLSTAKAFSQAIAKRKQLKGSR